MRYLSGSLIGRQAVGSLGLALFLCSVVHAQARTNGDQTVALSANAVLKGGAPAGHAVQWRVKSVPPQAACNFPMSGGNDLTVTTTQNPTTALFSRTGTYVLTFTDLTDKSSSDVTLTVVKNSDADGTVSKSRTVRILPLGDSITAESAGYRFLLQDKLKAGGYRFDFVGGRHLSINGSYDPDHEGHSGWETVNFPQSQEFAWGIDNAGAGSGYKIDIEGLQPDLVLLMFGTNDAGRGGDKASVRGARLFSIVEDIWAKAPGARIILAKIPPFAERNRAKPVPGYASVAAWVEEDNGLIGIRIPELQGQGKKISAVDMSAALTLGDLADGVHPNPGGYAKMAQAWYEGIVAVTTDGKLR